MLAHCAVHEFLQARCEALPIVCGNPSRNPAASVALPFDMGKKEFGYLVEGLASRRQVSAFVQKLPDGFQSGIDRLGNHRMVRRYPISRWCFAQIRSLGCEFAINLPKLCLINRTRLGRTAYPTLN